MIETEATIKVLDKIGFRVKLYPTAVYQTTWNISYSSSERPYIFVGLNLDNSFTVSLPHARSPGKATLIQEGKMKGFDLLEALAENFPLLVKKLAEPMND